jgi:uncharacterized membrane protein HdeD (DUF308 family)
VKIPINQNEPTMCRWVRFLIGVVLIILGTNVVTGTLGTILVIIGFLAIVSGIMGYCFCSAICSTGKKEGESCCFSPKK